jgi:hypothetical protein
MDVPDDPVTFWPGVGAHQDGAMDTVWALAVRLLPARSPHSAPTARWYGRGRRSLGWRWIRARCRWFSG